MTKKLNFNDSGGLNSLWLPDDDDGSAKTDNEGYETHRKLLFANNVVAAAVEDPNSGSFRFSVKLEDIFGFATDV